ncbi:conserved hypothetical protein [Gloeothece citriformis PCC 7424]|uniref:Uncharacterized protein n=1 Tax=Gloeothece citriformis (strain PCC 7424) TaxID=65393 RepID=B7KIJ4_GLOC7|nr:NfeD family protein [Gloeothece citriformis]ACK69400.1 conserved hypothetical protein [Gloeothece citriformis PCC 7424]
MNKDQWVIIAFTIIAIGVSLGVLFVILVKLKRGKTNINSLVKLNQIVGTIGKVQIPFDQNSKGKVRVKVKGSLIDLVAVTNFPAQFQLGEDVLIIEFKENKVWVVPEDYLRKTKHQESKK